MSLQAQATYWIKKIILGKEPLSTSSRKCLVSITSGARKVLTQFHDIASPLVHWIRQTANSTEGKGKGGGGKQDWHHSKPQFTQPLLLTLAPSSPYLPTTLPSPPVSPHSGILSPWLASCISSSSSHTSGRQKISCYSSQAGVPRRKRMAHHARKTRLSHGFRPGTKDKGKKLRGEALFKWIPGKKIFEDENSIAYAVTQTDDGLVFVQCI